MATGMCAAGGGRRRGLRVLAEALQQLELPTEVVVVVARGEVLVQPLASQLRIKRIDEDGGPCAHRRGWGLAQGDGGNNFLDLQANFRFEQKG